MADDSEIAGEAGKTVGIRRGRKTNRDKALMRMAMRMSPETVAPHLFPVVGAPYDLVEETGIEAKLSRISEIISGGLEKAGIEGSARFAAGEVDRVSLEDALPWLSQASPENQIKMLDGMAAANESIINALMSHLVEHIVIREDLREQGDLVRRTLEQGSAGIPGYMADFVSRLAIAGVCQDDIRYMSRARFNSVVERLKGISGEAELGADDSAERVDPTCVESKGAEAHALETVESQELASATNSAISGELISEPVEATDRGEAKAGTEPSAATHNAEISDAERIAETVDDHPVVAIAGARSAPIANPAAEAQADVPRGLWDVLDLDCLPYEIIERSAVTDADVEALKMKLPEVGSMRQLALPSGIEKSMVDGVEEFADLYLGERFIKTWMTRVQRRLSDEEIRAWLFLLVAIQRTDIVMRKDRDRMFDGLILPGPTGSSKVREIRAKQA